MSEHRPEVEWERPHYLARCLYPFACTWESKRYDSEAEANAAAEAHQSTIELWDIWQSEGRGDPSVQDAT